MIAFGIAGVGLMIYVSGAAAAATVLIPAELYRFKGALGFAITWTFILHLMFVLMGVALFTLSRTMKPP